MSKVLKRLIFYNKIIVLLGVISISPSLLAESLQSGITVKGIVVDKSKEPLVGVTVLIEGTSQGTVTDLDGKYTLAVPDAKSVLKFSYTGYLPVTRTVGNKTEIDIVLEEDDKLLNEVVVVGYGVQKKSHLTGAITKVNTDGLEDIPVSRIDQALQGRVAGVSIQNLTSEVGVAPEISFRGLTSISASSGPLVVIDGFPIDDGLGSVNMNDVESVEMLKDAASAAIYGSRAANGVILITTKSGTSETPKYSLKTSWGAKDVYKKYPMMTTQEYINMRMAENRLTGKSLDNNEFAYTVIASDTDWQEEALNKNSNFYNVQLNIQGGSKDFKYMISTGYTGDEGIMKQNKYDKMNVRAKMDANLSKRVSVGINLAPSYEFAQRPPSNYTTFVYMYPWMPVRHTAKTSQLTGRPEGSIVHGRHFANVEFSGIDPETGLERVVTANPSAGTTNNPVHALNNVFDSYKTYRLQSSAYLNINIAKGLDFKTSNSANLKYGVRDYYQNVDARKDGESGRARYENSFDIDMLTENMLMYKTKLKDAHEFDALLGFSAQKKTNNDARIYGVNFATDYIHTLNAAGQIDQYEGDSQRTYTTAEEETLVSTFGRINYAYMDRYLLSATLRADGSSKFGADNKWGWFPALSAGWRVFEEPFLKNKVSWINQLKLRASFGVTGTNNIENYANVDKLQTANYILGPGNGSLANGITNTTTSLGNRKLRWEQTNEFDTGFDFSILNNRLSVTFDYYYSITKSLLYMKNINNVSGFQTMWSNDGRLRNKGVEVEITSTNIKTNDVTWSTSFNISANKNRVIDLTGPRSEINWGSNKEGYIAYVGEKAIQFYGFKTVGVWKSQEEIDANPSHIQDKPGGLRVQDTNKDGLIDDKDRVFLGSPFPDFNWGMTNRVKYRDFDFSMLIQGSQGGKLINGEENYKTIRYWNKNYAEGRWLSPEHPGDGKTPHIDVGLPHALTDHPIQDASYAALRDVTLGYTFNKKTLKSLGISGIRIYSTIQNLKYWWASDYKGVNIEARVRSGSVYGNPLVDGFQRGAFPIQRTFSFGLDINF